MKSNCLAATFTFTLCALALWVAVSSSRGQFSTNITSRSTNQLDLVVTAPRGSEMQRAVLEKQDLKEIQRILKSGFNINDPIGCGAFNSVDGAVSVGNVKILKYLLANGAEPNGWALLRAAGYPKPQISFQLVEALLNAGADPGYKQSWPTNYVTSDTRQPATNRFETPLHNACYRGNASVVELLIKRPGVDLNVLDIDGRTPLMAAAKMSNQKIVELLLDKSAADSGDKRQVRAPKVLPRLESAAAKSHH